MAKGLIDCMQTTWTPILTKMNQGFDGPAVHDLPVKVIERGDQAGSCATEERFAAVYCPRDGVIYLWTVVFEQSQENPLRRAQVMIHEYMHHIQSLGAIPAFGDHRDVDGTVLISADESSRRAELQVFCMTARLILTAPKLGYDLKAHEWGQEWFRTRGSKTHGSTESTIYWNERGYSAKTIGD